jgi:glycosyltransferase involved in cell wall biosynthesis
MSIRLLYLTRETFPTHHADLTALFGKYLPRLGLFTDIVTEALDPSESEGYNINWVGGEAFVCDAPTNRGFYYITKLWHNIRWLMRCDPKKYDAIQVREQPVAALFALIIARYKKLSFYYWMSYPLSEGQILRARSRGWRAGMRYFFPLVQGYIGKFLLYKVIMPRADHVFVQSEKMREDLVQLGLPFAKMTPVPMAVDLEAAKIEDIPAIDDERLVGKRVVIYMGTLERTRRIDVLFEMIALVRETIPDVLLVIVGSTADADHLEWLKKEAERLAVTDSIVWTGGVSVMQAWRYARAAEVGLSPFPRGFLLDSATPTKAIEYMALNLPVLCNDNPDQAQAIQESGAGICVTLSAENFAEALLELLQNTERREQMATAGRKYIAQFRSYEKLSGDLFNVYQNLLRKTSV